MKNKLSQFFIDYMKNKKCKTFNQGGVDLTNIPSDKSWTELNPFIQVSTTNDDSILAQNVKEFIDDKKAKQMVDNYKDEIKLKQGEK